MRIFSVIFWILIVLLGISFAAVNARNVEIHYYLGTVNVYLPLLLLLELALGALLGIFALLPQIFKLKSMLRKSRQQVKQLEDKLEASQLVFDEAN